MISRTTVSLKTLKGKRVTIETKRYRIVKIKKPKKLPKGTLFLIPSKGDNPMGRKRKPGRPKGSKTKKGRKKSTRRSLPPRVKTGKRKGQFRKRKGKKKKKKKKRGNPNNCR